MRESRSAPADDPGPAAGSGAGPGPGGRGRHVGRSPVDRTSLAWQRTSASMALVALLAAIAALRLGEPAVGIAAAVLAVIGIVVGASTPRVRRSTAHQRDPWPLVMRATIVLGLSAAVGVMLAVSALFGE